jgi:hypothetical protein|tara:strand:- start:1752 stop:1937 length:186 start_codon:yes stop_codon:yes gene_type:complete
LTDESHSDHIKEWKSAAVSSHHIDSRIKDVVRFLARRSAEIDFKKQLLASTSLKRNFKEDS